MNPTTTLGYTGSAISIDSKGNTPVPDKLSDFNLEYDWSKPALSSRKSSVMGKLMDLPLAFSWFRTQPSAPVYLSNNPRTEIRVLFGVKNLINEIPPPMAEFRAFSKSADLGYYRVDALKQLIASDPLDGFSTGGYQPIVIAEYYNGKQRKATNGQFEFQCTITIPQDAWQSVERLGAGIGIEQIKGILNQDPILISQKSKQMGIRRCIKPEPYGWIFSTSVTTRLVAKNVTPQTNNPSILIFSEIESGH